MLCKLLNRLEHAPPWMFRALPPNGYRSPSQLTGERAEEAIAVVRASIAAYAMSVFAAAPRRPEGVR